MFQPIRNALNYVEGGSYDRALFSFSNPWNRTIWSSLICLAILFLSAYCIHLLRDPLRAGDWYATNAHFEWAALLVVASLVSLTIRDSLSSFRQDIEQNIMIDRANHWLSSGTFSLQDADGVTAEHCIGDMPLISTRAVLAINAIRVYCLTRHNDKPLMVCCEVDNGCAVTGVGEARISVIRRMLNEAAGDLCYNVADSLGIDYEPGAEEPQKAPRAARNNSSPRTGALSSPGSLRNLGMATRS